jgi:hypothetical protein
MHQVLKTISVALVLLTVALFVMGSYGLVSHDLLVAPFGLLSMSIALQFLVTRSDLWSRGQDRVPPGTPTWKLGLHIFWIVGLATTLLGVGFVVPVAGKTIPATWLGVALLVGVAGCWAIQRTRTDPRERVSVAETLHNAEVYLAYGRKAQAVAILEHALEVWPFDEELARTLAKARSGERAKG